MDHVEKCIEVDAPLSMVYNQWTQFEEFPRFMEGVEEVKQLDDKWLRWRAEIGGKVVEWDAEIFEQIPDSTIAWRSMSGVKNSGQVSFLPLGNYATKVCLKLHYDPEGTLENVADALGVGAEARADGLSIRGGKPTAGAFQSHGDHRIAMALAVAANAIADASTVSGWPAVESSYPEFANDLARVTDSV